MEMSAATLIGIWIAGFLTLCIFSFLYRDNPFYRFAEHLYVGVSAGYGMAIEFNNVLKPVLFGNLQRAWHEASARLHFALHGEELRRWGAFITSTWQSNEQFLIELSFVVPLVLGCLMLARLSKKMSPLSRYALAFLVGINAGFNIVYTMQAQILAQMRATVVPLWVAGDPTATILNWLLALGVLSGLVYFYFSREQRGPFFKGFSRIGIIVLMIAFGAAYGNTVMARISLLIGRLRFLQEWWGTLHVIFPAVFR